MQATQKLYETDSFARQFTAVVLDCAPAGQGWAVALDRTAFFPEGGGQPCDTGTLNGVPVRAVHLAGGVVTHITDAPLPVGGGVEGRLDWARRLDHMEQHTGEHILSGVLHRLYGAQNVGFHIGDPAVRMDIDLPLTAAQLAAAEAEANAAVRADTPVRCRVPAPEELAALDYRSKKELEGPVRLVEAGGDLCACCGTHLAATGQVGLIKILSAQNYKGGVRLAVACGQRAWRAVSDAWADAEAAGRLLSAAPGRLAPAVEHLQAAEGAGKLRLATLQKTLAAALARTAVPGRAACLYAAGADGDGLRQIALAVSQAAGAPCVAAAPGGQGLAYAVSAGPAGDARVLCRALNQRFHGRGGGSAAFCQGSLAADAAAFDEIELFIQTAGQQE